MPLPTDIAETSKKSKPKSNKRLSRKRSTNYENNPSNDLNLLQISPQQNSNKDKDNDLHTRNSSQKRTKNIAALLVSDLSPKYIGFNPTVEGKRRNRSQSMVNGNISPLTTNKEPNIIENEEIKTNSLSYMKMTSINTKNDNASSPVLDVNISTNFESPIEKLIKKNKELSNLSSSGSSANDQQDDFLSVNETPKKKTQFLSTRSKNKSIVEEKNENLFLLSQDNDTPTNPIITPLSKLSKRKKKLKLITIKKSKLKNSTKLVPLKNQIILSDSNRKNNFESEVLSHEMEIKNLKNTPQKIRSAQVVLHKSPQIERMHNEQMKNKKNSKIFQRVHILSEMTKTHNIEDITNNKIENISANFKTYEKQDLSPKFSNSDLIDTEINNDKECTTDKDNLPKMDTIVKKKKTISEILNNENLSEQCEVLNNENCNKKESLNVSACLNKDLQENHVSSEYKIDKCETMMKTSVDKEKAKYPALLDRKNDQIFTNTQKTVINTPAEKSVNIENAQSIICSDEAICETDMRTENLPISELPSEAMELSKNMTSAEDATNLKNTQSIICSDDDICETDLRTENLPISELPSGTMELSKNMPSAEDATNLKNTQSIICSDDDICETDLRTENLPISELPSGTMELSKNMRPAEDTENLKNTQSIICSDEDICETDLRTENLPMSQSPSEIMERSKNMPPAEDAENFKNTPSIICSEEDIFQLQKNISTSEKMEISKNMKDEVVEKVVVKEKPMDLKYEKNHMVRNESLETDEFKNMEIKTYATSRNTSITQIASKEINQFKNIITESSKILKSDKKKHHIDNIKVFHRNKFTGNDIHVIENSELALENILYENDVLGTGSNNTDEDFEIMNISSDFDDLNISTTSELETLNSDVQIDEAILSDINKDNRMENCNEKLSVKKNNLPIIGDTILESIPKMVLVHEKLNNKLIPNNLIYKNLRENELMGKETENMNISSSSQTEGTISLQKDTTTKQNNEQLQTTTIHGPTTSKAQIAPDNEAFAYTLMSNARATKSPLSTDSAKGSSIDIETNFHPKFGEIFWARISKYPFWPCIVWPDPDGKTISIGKNGSRQHIRIHVKFFADNGRRSWIRKEDLMAYNGREDFERKKKEFWGKNNISKRNLLARAFLINDSKKPLWNQAVIEASLVLNEHIEKRSEKFEKILEETRELQFFERRKKRLSLNERRSSLSSIAGSEEILNHRSANSYAIKKRDRSPTPESPAFEDVQDFKTFVKKRKLDLNTTNHLKKTSSLIQLNETSSSDLYESEEIDFNGFTELITAFIQPEKEEEHQLFINLKEIWEIKLRSEATKNFNLIHKNNNNLDGEQNLKRFSKRQTTLLFRRSLPVQTSTKEKSDKPKRERIPGVPIVKVVEDILELNKNYLFNGLKREPVCKVCLKPTNLYKCSANCQSWVHDECAELPEALTLPSKTKDRKTFHNNNSVIVNNSNITSNHLNITNPDLSVLMHVTGDEKLITENSKVNNEAHINENEILSSSNAETVQSVEVICKECRDKRPPICYVCKENVKANNENDEQTTETPIKCNINNCGRYFHISCLKYWPQARLTKSKTKIERFICPSHTCQTCVSDDPKSKFLKLQNCAKCVLCPASYHIDSTCIPAGSKIITASELICPRHRQNKQILNTNWCFICSDGGNLVCCESCPTSFHLECLNIAKLPDAGYICEECETGRLPLYGELIWAKFGVHKWWPCITIPPPQIPKNLYRVKHHEFDFCVRFFGTNDHSWISRDRVFLYQEDDWRYSSKVKTNDKDFIKSLEEANSISELLKVKKNINKNNDKKMLLIPTPYKKIYVNRPVPPVKLQEIDVSDALNPCDCNPDNEKPCDIFSGCLNRLLMVECHPKICPAGNKCNNQMFEKRLYAAVKVVRTNGRGFGLVSDELITIGTFIIEYVGEVIDDNELKRRIAQKTEEKDENYYFLTMQHGLIIDAGPKGNMARFMNHSCEPNCETQKWNVNGNTRIGLFAIQDIPPNTELTFNYNLECIGDDRKPCNCGAEKCAGFIGAKYRKIEKKNDIVTSETPKTEKPKSKGSKRNKLSLGSATNFPTPAAGASSIPKNS